MKFFNNIPIWENRRRLKLLKDFRGLVVTYFDNSDYSWQVEGRIEKPLGKSTRERINLNLNQVYPVVILGDVSPVMQWTPPPAIGGYIQNIDLLLNIFNLHNYQLPYNELLGYLDRAIGAYEADQSNSWVRTFNPFWWVNQLLIWVTHLPFKFLGLHQIEWVSFIYEPLL
ncbi:MAG: hypothetical protein WD425_04660, partial [Nitrospirales bacterium]